MRRPQKRRFGFASHGRPIARLIPKPTHLKPRSQSPPDGPATKKSPLQLRPGDSVGHREGIDVEALAADQLYPKLDPDGTSWGWTDEVEELNAFLDRIWQ